MKNLIVLRQSTFNFCLFANVSMQLICFLDEKCLMAEEMTLVSDCEKARRWFSLMSENVILVMPEMVSFYIRFFQLPCRKMLLS